MKTPEELQELDRQMAAGVEALMKKRQSKLVQPRSSDGRGRRPKSLHNELTEFFLEAELEEVWPIWIDDILSGVCRLDWYKPNERSIPLSARTLFNIFSALEFINVYEISQHIGLAKRMSQRYMKAVELAYPHLLRSSKDDKLLKMKYPEIFVYPRKEDELIDDMLSSDIGEDYES